MHFLGSRDAEAVGHALGAVEGRAAFPVRFTGPGHFALRGRKKILWVGVEISAPILGLHARVAEALAPLGYTPEERPYRPHVTLARLGPRAPHRLVSLFEQGVLPCGASGFDCARFALVESRTEAEGARYTELRSYPLDAPSGRRDRRS